MPLTDPLWQKMHHPKGSISCGRFILKQVQDDEAKFRMMGLAGRGDEEKKHHITIRVTQAAIAILHRSKTPARGGPTPKRGQLLGALGKFFSLTF